MTRNTILGSPSGGPETETDDDPAREESVLDDSNEGSAADTGHEFPPEDVETVVDRGRLYALLALGFERPGDDLEAAIDDGAFSELEEIARGIDPSAGEVAADVGDHLAEPETLRGRWASLFGVEEGLTVSPYEVTYLPGPLMTNVRKIADARGFYEAFGLSVADGANDRPDHLCFMLEFLSHLSRQEAYLALEGDSEGVATVRDARKRFVEDHLGRWYWRFADEVAGRDDGFYAVWTELLAALVESEIDRFGLEPDWVPDHPEVTEWNEDVFGDSGRGCGGCGMNDEPSTTDLEGAPAGEGAVPTPEGIGSPPGADTGSPPTSSDDP